MPEHLASMKQPNTNATHWRRGTSAITQFHIAPHWRRYLIPTGKQGTPLFFYPHVTQWQIRCAFNGFCKLALKREAMNAHRDTKQRQLREVTFSDLSPLEEKQLYVCDEYFADDEAEQSFVVGGKEITAKLLAEALHSLPEEKRETVLLYYFFDMSEREIAKFCNLSRTTVQSRRTSSMKLLKRYLEEKAYDCTD